MDRTILHCDCNGYFASVACLFDPSLRLIPMAVASDTDGKHGIILAKNELAKAYKIRTAETVISALRKCPQLKLVLPLRDVYHKYYLLINKIYEQYTDQVEPFGIDESWLDVTGSLHLFGSGKEIADTLRRRIREELGLTISVGVSFNKVFAKLGSDYKKPDATTVFSRETYQRMIYPLPAQDMLFVGRNVADTLARAQIHTIGDLARASQEKLTRLLGKMGPMLWAYANGMDDTPVKHAGDYDPVKSIGNNITFDRNLIGWDDIRMGLRMLSEQVGTRLRRQGMRCQTVQVQIKNPQLKVISRQKTLEATTDLSQMIYETAVSIVARAWDVKNPIRMLSVSVTQLSEQGAAEQLNFFVDEQMQQEKRRRLETAIDGIRARFGDSAVSHAALLHNDLTSRYDEQDENADHGEPPNHM